MTVGRSDGAPQLSQFRPGHRAPPELAAAVDSLPVALLLLAEDGTAVEVNGTWASLSGIPARASCGYGWLQAVDPFDRLVLRALIHDAAKAGQAGSGVFRMVTAGAEQACQWWWGPGPAARQLIVSVAALGDSQRDDQRLAALTHVANMVAHRLFGVGLVVQAAAGVTEGSWRRRLQEAVDELDSVIRDVRSAVF